MSLSYFFPMTGFFHFPKNCKLYIHILSTVFLGLLQVFTHKKKKIIESCHFSPSLCLIFLSLFSVLSNLLFDKKFLLFCSSTLSFSLEIQKLPREIHHFEIRCFRIIFLYKILNLKPQIKLHLKGFKILVQSLDLICCLLPLRFR